MLGIFFNRGDIKLKGNQQSYDVMVIYYCVISVLSKFSDSCIPCKHLFLGYLYSGLQAFILTEEADDEAVVLNVTPVTTPAGCIK